MIYVRDRFGQPIGASALLYMKNSQEEKLRIATNFQGAFELEDWSNVKFMKVWHNGGHWKQLIVDPENETTLRPDEFSADQESWWKKKMGVSERPTLSGPTVGVIDHVSRRVMDCAKVTVTHHYEPRLLKQDSHGDHVCQVFLGNLDAPQTSPDRLSNGERIQFYDIAPPLAEVIGSEISTSTALIQGILYLSHLTDVSVISISQGIISDEHSDALEAAVFAAKQNGVICVAASGNSPNDLVALPARLEDVVSVGGVGLNGLSPELSYVNHLERMGKITLENSGLEATGEWFSCPNASYRGGVDVVGPSSAIILTNSHGYAIDFEGTSYACPVVARALMERLKQIEEFSTLSGEDRYERSKLALYSMCVDLGLPNERQGKGLPTCEAA